MPLVNKVSEVAIIGRDAETAQIQAFLAVDRHVLLVGQPGIGTTTLLVQLAKTHPKAIYIDHLMPMKPALTGLLKSLHETKGLTIPDMEVEYLQWQDLQRKLERLNIQEIKDIAISNLSQGNILLLLDHLEELSFAKISIVEAFMPIATVVGATSKKKWTLHRLWDRFDEVVVPPLKKEAAQALLWQTLDRNTVADSDFLEKRVLYLARNHPGGIVAMIRDLHGEEITRGQIRELKPPPGIASYLDLTPLVLFLSTFAFCVRLFGLGKNNIELYLLGGMGYAIFSLVRYFAYRSSRHE